MNVEFEAVGSERRAIIERGHRILGRERAAAAMREDQRARGSEKPAPLFG